ncbi:hypothetical protein B0T14DRAFT_523346 [Immersiella caudata]|uniref:NACHT domain-containing protein n=1 Tax=Immersiella caudata TaxID=314043 RepID=A0AA40BWW7_9PEZI|nr:hypothetical protein B0T14DRAFT_523346 [Immersiella caudata]
MMRSRPWGSFVHGQENRSLWIHGIPGVGKTILVSHLVSRLKRLQADRIGWIFYYRYFGHRQDETEPFLKRIIAQLCQQASVIPTRAVQFYERHRHPSLLTALSIIATLLDKFFNTAYVTVDGIDKSKPYSSLLMLLIALMTDTRFAKFRFLVSSREYLDIELVLKPHAVAVSMTNEAVPDDIQTFLGASLRSNPKFRSWPPSLCQEIEAALANGAKGM